MSGTRWTEKDVKDYQRKRQGADAKPVKEVTDEPQYRSGWEREYAELLDARKKDPPRFHGFIQDYQHEPIKLRLFVEVVIKNGKRRRKTVYYIPDFMIIHLDGSIEMVEVKGYERKPGELKYMAAVEKYPCFTWRKVTKEDGRWVDMHYKKRR